MRYESLERKLARYEQVTLGDTRMYLKGSEVVATQEKNVIVMYFRCSRDVIWNHHDVVAVAVAKDFVIVKDYKKTVADVVVVEGLCGACNSIERRTNRLLEHDCCSVGLEFDEEYGEFTIGTIGYAEKRGVFKFYDNSVTINVPLDMCSFDFDKLNYCILKVKKSRKEKKHPKKIQAKDYEVFKYLRKENAWNWESGFETTGSAERRRQIERTRRTNFHKLAKATVVIK